MSLVLLDTNIVSYLFKGDSRAALYAPHLLNQELAVAMMTIAELFQWAMIRNWGATRLEQLEQLLVNYTVLPVDIDLCRHWAAVRATRSSIGQPISPQDAWIAATARRYKLPLITHNPDDFQNVPGVTIISESWGN
jgi:tRNA(fMet)-specific endonuclease VapC